MWTPPPQPVEPHALSPPHFPTSSPRSNPNTSPTSGALTEADLSVPGITVTFSCVQVEEHHAVDIDVYHCPNCEVPHGPSLMKKRKNWHRHDYTEPDDGSKPVQAGTLVFVRELQARTFASAHEVLMKMHGTQVTQRYLERHGFRYPIAVPQKDGLGLQLPSSDFSVNDVERYVGASSPSLSVSRNEISVWMEAARLTPARRILASSPLQHALSNSRCLLTHSPPFTDSLGFVCG
ncbi:lysine-specific demethylase 7B isoform X1 [Tachysurus ichikawai]